MCRFIVTSLTCVSLLSWSYAGEDSSSGDVREPNAAGRAKKSVSAKLKKFVRKGKLTIPQFAYMPKVGDIGYLPEGTSVSQRLDSDDEALVLVPYISRRQPPFPSRTSLRQLSSEIQRRISMGPAREPREVYVRGCNFSKLVDGQNVIFDVPFEVVGTKTFATANGGSITVHVMEPLNKDDLKQIEDSLRVPAMERPRARDVSLSSSDERAEKTTLRERRAEATSNATAVRSDPAKKQAAVPAIGTLTYELDQMESQSTASDKQRDAALRLAEDANRQLDEALRQVAVANSQRDAARKEVATALERVDEIRKLAKTQVESARSDLAAARNEAETYKSRMDWAESELKYYADREQAERRLATHYYLRGISEVEKQEYEKAIRSFTAAIEQYPKDARFFYMRAFVRHMTSESDGQLDDATQDAKRGADIEKLRGRSETQAVNRALERYQGKARLWLETHRPGQGFGSLGQNKRG